MIHLIYVSSATSWPTEAQLLELLEQARARNLRQNITGMLLYNNATYMQVLEGEEKDVHEIFEAISQDSRITGVVKLHESKIEQRDFPDWSMGFRDLSSYSPDELPGYVDFFSGQLDKEVAINNKMAAINLLKVFANNTGGHD